MSGPTTIYHGTPMTPRDALVSVCNGRAMCVSFYRPDDVEVAEAISPAVMFRQRRVFVLAASSARRERVGRASRLDTLLRVVGAAPVSSGQVGDHSRQPWCAVPAQRCALGRVAVRTEGRSPLAHGRADRTAAAPVRPIRPGVSGVDRQDGRLTGLSRAHGRSEPGLGQPLAYPSHDARYCGCVRLPVRQRGQHLSRTERVAL
jgi:hypothetical protein